MSTLDFVPLLSIFQYMLHYLIVAITIFILLEKRKFMFQINDFYIGLIFAHPSYFSNPKAERWIGDVSYDPFQEIPPAEAITMGLPVLLKKKGDSYYDEENCRWENELAYQLNTTSPLGITLAHVKPFTECYHEELSTYIAEEIETDDELLEEMISTHSYTVIHSKLNRKDNLVILQGEPMQAVQYEYFRNVLGEEAFETMWNNTFQKKK